MSSFFCGNRLEISVFGESHGKAVGAVAHGIPAGLAVDFDFIEKELRRRAGGYDLFSTLRREPDDFEFLSGIFNGRTTGAPIAVTIQNKNTASEDYEKLRCVMRPNHCDYPAFVKFNGFNDYRGGGHFSGRLTAAVVCIAAVIKQCLFNNNIYIASHISSIGGVEDSPFSDNHFNSQFFVSLSDKDFPLIDDNKLDEMRTLILSAKEQGDSVGGSVEFAAIGVPAGLGNPFFGSVESVMAGLMFSIPAVKALEFGLGTKFAEETGSRVSDGMYFEGEKLKTYTNNCGGICGGITNSMPIFGKVSFKPTPSISKAQSTVDISSKKNTKFHISGRHDPCIVKRAVPVVEAMAAVALFDLL